MGITREQALDCFASDDLIGMGMEADAVRRRLHPEGVVTYTIEYSIGSINSETLDELSQVDMSGATHVALHGRCGGASLVELETVLASVRKRFPDVPLSGVTAEDILFYAQENRLDVRTTVARLRDAGLSSISGDRAGRVPTDAQQAQGQSMAEDLLSVHRTAHSLGMTTTASMTFGAGETPEQRVHHLDTLRQMQDETGGLTAFTPWSYLPASTITGGLEEPTAVEYLKTLAISRMYLDNIQHVESSAAIQGLKVLQMCLRFGADDVGPVTPLRPSGPSNEEELRRIIRDAGLRPVQRDAHYRILFLY